MGYEVFLAQNINDIWAIKLAHNNTYFHNLCKPLFSMSNTELDESIPFSVVFLRN